MIFSWQWKYSRYFLFIIGTNYHFRNQTVKTGICPPCQSTQIVGIYPIVRNETGYFFQERNIILISHNFIRYFMAKNLCNITSNWWNSQLRTSLTFPIGKYCRNIFAFSFVIFLVFTRWIARILLIKTEKHLRKKFSNLTWAKFSEALRFI